MSTSSDTDNIVDYSELSQIYNNSEIEGYSNDSEFTSADFSEHHESLITVDSLSSEDATTSDDVLTWEDPVTSVDTPSSVDTLTESESNHSAVTSEAMSVNSELAQVEANSPEFENNENRTSDVEDQDVIFIDEANQQRGEKRELEDEDSNEITKKKRIESDEDDDGNLCPICFDIWTNQGEHRVCCLKCGHLFGHSCLLRWFRTQPGNKKTCPTCKRKVFRNDARFIYVKKLLAADTSQIEALKKELEIIKEEKSRLQTQINTYTFESELTIKSLRVENELLRKLSTGRPNVTQNKRTITELRCWMDKSLEISSGGGCRVLDYNPALRTVVVSLISPNPIFTGYGIRKIMMTDYKSTAFIAVHTKAIRDLSFKDNTLLSVSLDCKAKLINMNTNSEVASFSSTAPLWSCCWDADDPNIFYAGESRGTVSVFDIRNSRESLTELQVEGDGSPVVSLASVKWQSGGAMPRGGILCCKLNSCWAFEKTANAVNTFESKPLPLEGPFMSLRYNNNTGHILVSARANQRQLYTRHILCELTQTDSSTYCNVVHTYQGAPSQSMLSRPCLFSLQDNFYAAAYHASDSSVMLWSAKTGLKAGSVPAHMPILDLCTIENQDSTFLITLNEKKMDFFQIDKAI